MTENQQIATQSHNDWDRATCILGSRSRWRTLCDNNVNLEANQFSGKGVEPIKFPFRDSVLYDDVFTLDVTEFSKTLAQTAKVGFPGSARKKSYTGNFLRLLCLGGTDCSESQTHQ